MNTSAPVYTGLRPGISPDPHLHFNCNQESSTGLATTSAAPQSSNRKSPFHSAGSTPDRHSQNHYVRQRRVNHGDNMATYYLYKKDGTVTSSHMNPKARVFTRGLQGTTSHGQHEDNVGAYPTHLKVNYPAPSERGDYPDQNLSYQQQCPSLDSSAVSEPMERSHWSSDEHESSGCTDSSRADSNSTMSYTGWDPGSTIARPYPDPEVIRHMHTLHSLLPYLLPARKLNAPNGPTIDIVEQDSGMIFGQQVPKKLLVLFLGRKVVNKYIRTIPRANDKNGSVSPTFQELRLPRGKSSKSAIQILISWMMRACEYSTMNTMDPINVPKKTFVACSLAQTMELFSLHKDALRVDHTIVNKHFVRPIFAEELESLWNCLGAGSRYVYAAVKVVGKRIQELEGNDSKVIRGINDDMYALMKKHPRLEARLSDLDLNEQYKPDFSTDWTKKLAKNKHDDEFDKSQDTNQNQSPNEIEGITPNLGALPIVSDQLKPLAGAEMGRDVNNVDSGSVSQDGHEKPES